MSNMFLALTARCTDRLVRLMKINIVSLLLPTAQTVLALLLMSSNDRRANRLEDPAWNKPDIQTCHALNSPVALVVSGLAWIPDHVVTSSLQLNGLARTVYLFLVWFLWYGLSVEIRSPRGSAQTALLRGRPFTDAFAIAYGLLMIAQGFGFLLFHGAPYWPLRATGSLGWGAAFVGSGSV